MSRLLVNHHVENFVREVYAESLLEAGFTDIRKNGICWVRLKGDQIVQSVCFSSEWNRLPVLLHLSRGIYPLFSELYLPKNVHDPYEPLNDERTIPEHLMGSRVSSFSTNISVMAPVQGNRGLDILLDKFLPVFDRVNTIEACYLLAKEKRISEAKSMEQRFHLASEVFIEMAIYLGDEEVFPYCLKEADRRLSGLNDILAYSPNNSNAKKELLIWQQLRSVLLDGGREEFIEKLEARKKENLLLLNKKFGITASTE